MFQSIAVRQVRSPLQVSFVFSDDRTPPSKEPAVAASVSAAFASPGFRADAGECLLVGHASLVVGLGTKKDLTASGVRTIGAKLAKWLDRAAPAAIELQAPVQLQAHASSLAEGIAIAQWRFDDLDGAATRKEPRRAALAIWSDAAKTREAIERGLVVADAVNAARRFGATPPNICNPQWVDAQARALARKAGLKHRVIDFRQAQKLGMGGLVNVGKGSAAKPCIAVLEHAPRRLSGRARGKHLVLIGKTLTYDTGGYSLKVNNGMKGMKYDKMGGAAVLGAMQAIAALDLPVRVTAVLGAAENMVNGESYRPDDIITMHNGVTVEVTNTDAEGRLVLADAMSWACRTLKPTHLIDLATLTGGVVTALGHFSAGLFCNDPSLRAGLEQSAAATGEKVWALPLWPEHRDYMRGQHADLINSNPSRMAHPIQGAAFLSFFVDDALPWAHLDIAGVANSDSATDLCAAGPTGWGVRLLVDWVRGQA